MSESDDSLPRLHELLSRLCDGPLSDSELAELECLVLSSDEATAIYVQYLHLHAAMSRYHFAAESPALAAAQVPVAVPQSGTFLKLVRRVPGGEFTVGALTILAVVAAFWGLATKIIWPKMGGHDLAENHADRQPAAASRQPDAVATITGTADAQWAASHKSENQNFKSKIRNPKSETNPKSEISNPKYQIAAGEPLAITSGLVELQLKQGATLLIEGPAEWSIDGQNNATLKRGKLVAKVPQKAIGFTLVTPTAKIVDLGTEFRAEVSDSRATEVNVITGEIRVSLADALSRRTPSVDTTRRLVAGQSVHVTLERGELTFADGAPPRELTMPSYRTAKLDLARLGTVSDPHADHFPGTNAIDDNLETYSHTAAVDDKCVWRVDVGSLKPIAAIVLLNRRDIAGGRLRDITVTLFESDGVTVAYRSPLLNPGNKLGGGIDAFDDGPPQLIVDLVRETGAPVEGQIVEVSRQVCTNGPRPGDNDLLSLGECQVFEGVEIIRPSRQREDATR